MKHTVKMVLLTWERWESLKSRRTGVSGKDTADVGVQTALLQADIQIQKASNQNIDCKKKRGHSPHVGDTFVDESGVDLPRPPASFVNAYFEHGGGAAVKKKKKTEASVKRPVVPVPQFVKGTWVTLK